MATDLGAPSLHVINLDRSSDRLAEFHRHNDHIGPTTRFPAIDGSRLERAALVEQGLITEDCPYGAGTLGTAMSHTSLWKLAAEEDRAVTIVEDDAIFAKHFRAASDVLLKKLPADWDLVMWGWNFDAYLWVEIPEGVSSSRIHFKQDELRGNIERFKTSQTEPTPLRLRHGFGLMAYTVRPSAARILLDACLPFRKTVIPFPGYGIRLENKSTDSMVNAAYPRMKAYASLPPLVVAENRHDASVRLGQ